jgi:hypothetical protein
MRSSPMLVLLALLLVLPGAPVPLGAQESATLAVTVRAADTGRPLAGAQVLLRGAAIRASTDEYGVARLQGLAPGSQMLEARFLGYAATSAPVVLEPGREATLSLHLPLRPIPLAEVRVRARTPKLLSSGFYQRKSGGFGTFITRAEITEMNPRFMSDVLRRVAGISLQSMTGGRTHASIRGVKTVVTSCPVQYYVDGALTYGFNIDDMHPRDVEGVEIYRGAATIPPAFNKGTAMCGAVLIWTRVE